MQSQNFTTSFLVDQSPAEAFANIHDVRAWWTGGEIEGGTDKLGDEFTYRVPDVHYSKQKMTELVPDKKVAWRVVDAYLNFTDDPREWTGTEITFETAASDSSLEESMSSQDSSTTEREPITTTLDARFSDANVVATDDCSCIDDRWTGAVASVVALQRMNDMDMAHVAVPEALSSFVSRWVLMTTAMMLPGAAPTVIKEACNCHCVGS